tara:strand:+ start:12568 stop:13749 length:1182 start_codon:yes stop_codon:yes gene_type:complete
MKINNVVLRGYSVLVSNKSTWFVLEMSLDGAVGYGDATVLGSEAELTGLIGNLCRWVETRPDIALPDLTRYVMQNDPTLARRGLASALEQAWYGALAARARVPIASMLGGPVRSKIPFYANINRGIVNRSPEGFASRALEILNMTGAAGVKIAPFDGFRTGQSSPREANALIATGIERAAAVRQAIGPDTLLLIDCHSRFSSLQAIDLIRELAKLDVFWVEDPCDMDSLQVSQLHRLRGFANALGLRVAGGESVLDFNEMTRLLAREGHDVVLPDLRYTGIAQGMAMMRLADSQGVELSLHNPVGPVLNAMAVHVASALPTFLILERQLGETPLYEEIVDSQMVAKDGNVFVPTRAGLGLELRKTHLGLVTASEDSMLFTRTFSGIPGAGPDA